MVAAQYAAFSLLIVNRAMIDGPRSWWACGPTTARRDARTATRTSVPCARVDAFAWRINRLEQRALGTAGPRRRCLARV